MFQNHLQQVVETMGCSEDVFLSDQRSSTKRVRQVIEDSLNEKNNSLEIKYNISRQHLKVNGFDIRHREVEVM